MQLVKSATVFSFLLAAAACGEEYVYTGGAPDAPLPGVAVRTDMFADATIWKKPNIYRGALVFTQACGRVSVSGKISTNNYDTAWGLAMKPQPLTAKGPWYALSFGIASKPRLHKTRGGPTYSSAVVWYDADGKEIAREPISLRSRLDERRRAVHLGRIPDAAARFAVNVGFDWPNLLKGDFVTLDSLDLRVLAQEPGADWVKMPDFEAPRVRLASDSPFTDPAAELRVSVTARRPLDWSTLRVSVDGTDVTAKVRRDGNVVAYAPSAPWAPGLHQAEVKIADPEAGGMFLAKKTFFRGDPPQGVPHVTLRDDGVTLVDGKPFFPVGIYGVMKREYNGFDFDRGLRDLAAGGFNLVHSYTAGRTKEFLDAAHRHGLKTWTAEYSPGKEFVETLRHHPAPIAWYVGDDTAMHFTPSEIYDRVDAIKAIDPYRITVQADGMGSAEPVTNYRPFVKTTDGFLPEIYPVRGTNAPPDPQCVAKTVRDMERLAHRLADHPVFPRVDRLEALPHARRAVRDELRRARPRRARHHVVHVRRHGGAREGQGQPRHHRHAGDLVQHDEPRHAHPLAFARAARTHAAAAAAREDPEGAGGGRVRLSVDLAPRQAPRRLCLRDHGQRHAGGNRGRT